MKIIKITNKDLTQTKEVSKTELTELMKLLPLKKCTLCSSKDSIVYHTEVSDLSEVFGEKIDMPKPKYLFYFDKIDSKGVLKFVGAFRGDGSDPASFGTWVLGLPDENIMAERMAVFFNSKDLRKLADLLDKHGFGESK